MTVALITGFTGMVGSHLADYLLENTDWEIYGMCRWRSPIDNIRHLIPRINSNDRVAGTLPIMPHSCRLSTRCDRIMYFIWLRNRIRRQVFLHR